LGLNFYKKGYGYLFLVSEFILIVLRVVK